MGKFFGTDGIRGKFNEDLTVEVAYKIGSALGSELKNSKILIGRDTRISGSVLTLAFACGAMCAGANVINIDICPTAAISFLVTKYKFDFGVIITASHNPSQYNGIKIFDKYGQKIGEKLEESLENKLLNSIVENANQVGLFENKTQLLDDYIEYLINLFDFNLKNKRIVLDCANGAGGFVAQKIFNSKGAKIISTGMAPDGYNINKDCGALNVSNLIFHVKKFKADFGFAFDGDADRIVAVDENGKVFNGDLILYIFAKYFKSIGQLSGNTVVGTKHTNFGVEKALNNDGIKLIRTEIGDKFVSLKLNEQNLILGAEQSGHIIIKKYMPTGDGILSALLLSYILVIENKKLSNYLDFKLYSQANVNVEVKNRQKIICNKKLLNQICEIENSLSAHGRVMVRPSGTEPCIRVMVETENESVSQKYANEIAFAIKQIDSEG